MVTKTINLYSFKELSKEAQNKALARLADINTSHNWWNALYEDAKNIGLIIDSFDDHKCTGELENSLNETCYLIQNNHGIECATYKLATDYKKQWDELVKKYSDGISTESVIEENEAEFDLEADQLEAEFERRLIKEYKLLLNNEQEYLTSKEAIIEAIESNDYTFRANGKMENLDTQENSKVEQARKCLEEAGYFVSSLFCDDDIIGRSEHLKVSLSSEQLIEVKRRMGSTFDACIGINWDVIDSNILSVVNP